MRLTLYQCSHTNSAGEDNVAKSKTVLFMEVIIEVQWHFKGDSAEVTGHSCCIQIHALMASNKIN